jgi:hypothetical protein
MMPGMARFEITYTHPLIFISLLKASSYLNLVKHVPAFIVFSTLQSRMRVDPLLSLFTCRICPHSCSNRQSSENDCDAFEDIFSFQLMA